ncbi:MAG: IclR family transcriptional regulator C-terminal domain-containing protein [Rhodospirillaceae bacterium]|nr:IclR family transcriptional regulator C-terminal domain-containing protein [Rhodospirillaceae bacterium]
MVPASRQKSSVRALIRGLEILRVLNTLNGATPNKVATVTRLPRGTTYRILETLERAGYVARDATDGKYRVTVMVRGLGDGFEDQAWVGEIAAPRMTALGKEVMWPLGLSTLYGTQLLVRYATDRDSVLALKRYSIGHRLSLVSTASGRVFMAFTTPETRETLLDMLAQSTDPKDRMARDRALLNRILAEVRKQGYAQSSTPIEGESAISVPVFASGRLLGMLALRYIDSALTTQQVVKRYLARLQETAADIGQAFAAAAGQTARDNVTALRARGGS